MTVRLTIMGEVFGLLVLLLVGAIATLVTLSVLIARDAVRPPRHTAGYAVAHGLPIDPGDIGLDFDAWVLELSRQVTLPIWEMIARGPGGTVIFVHGWGDSRIDLFSRLDPWVDRCSRLVLYDRSGHGEATGGRARLGCGEQRDLLALLERLGEGPFILIGHGTGAAVAIAAAADGGVNSGIAGVVACEPVADVHTAIRDRLHARGLPTRPLTDLAMLWLRLTGIRQRDMHEDMVRLGCRLLIDPGPGEIESLLALAATKRRSDEAT